MIIRRPSLVYKVKALKERAVRVIVPNYGDVGAMSQVAVGSLEV